MNFRFLTSSVFSLLCAITARGADPHGQTSWEHAPSAYKPPADLVKGGAFIDRILPMPVGPGDLSSDCWGGDTVKPRNVRNGIEDPKWSYWCMSVHTGADGREHLFGARWPESAPKGHMSWSDSRTFHAVADSPLGPFAVVEEDIGPGHNVTWYRAKDGTHVIYHMRGAYTSASENGPWKPASLQYDNRGTPPGEMTNHKFVPREDGSVLMISRGGRTWISEDGLKPFRKITLDSAYPKIPGKFEDPEVWRDEVQYHMIVNDWHGRTAYYLRSKDGVDWVWDQGIAYDVGIARHADGSRENWYKFERPAVRQDRFGRATHMYFAAIDTRKDLDRANDSHGSKIIALPLVVQRRMEILDQVPLSPEVRRLRVKIMAEPGFDPASDMKLETLRFGAPSAVDYGRGMKAVETRAGADHVVVTFEGQGGFSGTDFVAKLLGSDAGKGMLYGYARIPGVAFVEPMLDAPPPVISATEFRVKVENFGQVPSQPGTLVLVRSNAGKEPEKIERPIPAIAPYSGSEFVIPLPGNATAGAGGVRYDLEVRGGGKPLVRRDLRPPAAPAKPEASVPPFLKKHEALYRESPRKAALAWYEDARLGMFIHWGVWGKHHAAWAMYQKRIPLGEYQAMARQVDASGFKAREIVRLAEDAGMRYITFVAKHHDGFCLWDSKATTWDSMDYPMHRDFVRELSAACSERGMPLFIYYSIGIDWTHPYFIPRELYSMARPDYARQPEHFAYREPADFEKYRTFCKDQLTELCTQYGPVAGFWFDTLGGVLANSDMFKMQEFYDLIHRHQPHALILFKTGATGTEDVLVGERKLESIAMHYSGNDPQTRRIRGLADAAWQRNFQKKAEIAVTSQGNWEWGPQQRCQNVDGLWNMLVSAADNNANLLLNFGPMPDGSIPADVAAGFRQLGERIRSNGYPPPNRATYLTHRGHGGPVDGTEKEKTAR